MYKVQRCQYPVEYENRYRHCWLIISDDLPYPFWANYFLCSLNSSQTAKQYAYKICKLLNYMDSFYHISYLQANESHLSNFIRNIQFRGNSILDYEVTETSEYTIKGYVAAIKKLYCFLKNHGVDLNVEIIVSSIKNRKSFLYGQNYYTPVFHIEYEHNSIQPKESKNYIKWYSDEEIEAIISNFNTNRDKAIFSMTLDGMRIDEVISSQMRLYDDKNHLIKLYRSKGKVTNEEKRTCALRNETVKYLEQYLRTERSIIEEKLLCMGRPIPDDIFLNIKTNSSSLGKPVTYHNYYEILKKAASRAGLDASRIRTHSGRSTAVGRFIREQAKNPGTISDAMIREHFGWKSIDSAQPYKNRQDPLIAYENHKILEKIYSGK